MSYLDKQTKIDELQQKIQAHGKLNADVQKKINYKFRLDWNYYSNRMEGGTLTREETRSVMVGNIDVQGKPLKDVMEMNGHDKVVLEILKIGKGELRIAEKRIKDIHKAIMHEEDAGTVSQIGNWKSQANEIINYNDEKISFTPPSEVAEAMHALLDKTNAELDAFFANKKSPHPLVIASQFHIGYVSIHPFYDGNGRTARILNNLLLISCGLPPIIIKDKHKKAYYQLLADIQAYGGNAELFYAFIGDRIIESQQLVLDAIEGKDISEVDDLEKELQQIEIKLKSQEEKVVKRSSELVDRLFEQSIKPLSDSLYEKLIKFNKFFAEFTMHTLMDGQGNSGNKELVDTVLPEYFKKENVREITINYQWGGFNRAGANTFWLSSSLKISLSEFGYVINEEQMPEYKPGFKKLYSQQLTQQEIDKIVEDTSSKALASMKQSYKQITGKDL